MLKVLGALANLFGVLGVVLCGFSGLVRLAGYYEVFGYELMTLFVGGIGLMVMACLAKLYAIAGEL